MSGIEPHHCIFKYKRMECRTVMELRLWNDSKQLLSLYVIKSLEEMLCLEVAYRKSYLSYGSILIYE